VNGDSAGERILGIIPARGHSNGLPAKHLRLLCGRPLLAHTIRAALEARGIDLIAMSTDDPAIATLARAYPVEVIDRPAELATDTSPTADAVLHALSVLEDMHGTFAHLVLLQPTSPLRNAMHIDAALKLYFQCGTSPLISVTCNGSPPQKDFLLSEDMRLVPLFSPAHLFAPRQSLPPTYRQNGAIYISSRRDFLRQRSFYGERAIPYVMDAMSSVDVDNQLDFDIAEMIMSKLLSSGTAGDT
jgi:CMP-N,N'-diacetyllegionaminic acid synthase